MKKLLIIFLVAFLCLAQTPKSTSVGGFPGASIVAAYNLVTAAANYTSGNLVKAAASNKTTSDSGIAAADVVTAASASDVANKVCVASGATKTCSYISMPEVIYSRAANCNNVKASAIWAIGSGGTVSCR